MSGKVRVGVIGTSWWTEMMYLPSLKSHSRRSWWRSAAVTVSAPGTWRR